MNEGGPVGGGSSGLGPGVPYAGGGSGGPDLTRLISAAQATTIAVNNLNQSATNISTSLASLLYGIPTGATVLIGASGNQANAQALAFLAPSSVTQTAYITGFIIQSSGATGALVVNPTVTGLIGSGTLTYTYTCVAGATTANTDFAVTFPAPIPANDVNTHINVILPALGAGNAHASVVVYGYCI